MIKNNTKIEENGTESDKYKTDFAKKTFHKNKFYVKYSIREKDKNTEKLNFGDNYKKIEDNDTESEIDKADFTENTSLALDYNS